jgi:ubiquitin C-terminal hydrolase
VRKIGTGTFTGEYPNVGRLAKSYVILLPVVTMVPISIFSTSPTNSLSGRKRKHDELFSDSIKDDPRFISANTTISSCRANGLRGIYNAGATCYQNVVLQSFLHNPLLRNFYLSDGHQSGDCQVQHCLSCAMDDMFQDFYAVENTNGYTAANILSGFWISERKAFENLVTTKEQDAHEFFQFLAEELHERNGDGKKPEIGSEHSCNCVIHQTFYGKMQTTTTCQNCHGTSSSVQSFLDLSLGLDHLVQKRIKKTGQKKPSLTLKDCLDEEYIKSDKCEYRCNHCNSTQMARRHASIKRLPNVLSIQLKVSGIFMRNGIHGENPSNERSGSSTSKVVMTERHRKSKQQLDSRFHSTCCPTQIDSAVVITARIWSWSGHAHTTF